MRYIAGSGKLNVDLIYSGVSRLPDEGEEIYASRFDMCLGGGAPGTLINLARLGVPVKLQTAIGFDVFSNFAKSELKNYNMTLLNVYSGNDIGVNVTTAMVTKTDRTFMTYGGEIEPTEKRQNSLFELAKDADFVLMEKGYLPVYKKLKRLGVKLVMDFGWHEDLSLDAYGEYLEVADYFLPNKKEALSITKKESYLDAAKVLSQYFDDVIIKLDSAGAYVLSNGKGEIVPSIASFVRKDSTGAGDAFLAGFLYGLFKEYPLKKAVMCGNLAGGKCVTGIGCLAEYMTESEMEAYLAKIYE